MKNSTLKSILRVMMVLIVLVLVVKLVAPVNDVAREYLPEPLLRLIGEEPKGLLEKGTDGVKGLIDKIN